MPLHTVALGAALTPTVLHTLISHVGSCMGTVGFVLLMARDL
jgi:hypothetical protein